MSKPGTSSHAVEAKRLAEITKAARLRVIGENSAAAEQAHRDALARETAFLRRAGH